MRQLPLFAIRVRHDVHADRVCRDIALLPTGPTARLFERHRLRLQATPDGIAVSAVSDEGGRQPLIALPLGQVFAFDLAVRNPAFLHHTEPGALAAMRAPVYRNTEAGGAVLQPVDRETWGGETLVAVAKARKARYALAGRPLARDGDASKAPRPADFDLVKPGRSTKAWAYDVASKTITVGSVQAGQQLLLRYRTAAPKDRRVFATIELRYHAGLPAPGQAQVPFEIRFQARAARWAYYLVTDRTGDYTIVDARPAGPPLTFSAAQRTVLGPADEAGDPCAQALARQHADLTRIRFLSDQPVPCSSTARRGLELRLDGETVLAAMPNPPFEHAARIRRQAAGTPQIDDVFHQVVHLLKTR